MSRETEKKKKEQLGMAQGTARNKLVKSMMFDMICKLDLNWCFQCGTEILCKSTMSIEHKVPWLDSSNPEELYFDLDNIAFSHTTCNYGARRRLRTGCVVFDKGRNKWRAEVSVDNKKKHIGRYITEEAARAACAAYIKAM